MFCLKCGEVIIDTSENCPKCGDCLREESIEQAIVYASQKSVDEPILVLPAKKPPKKIFIISGIIVCVIVIFLIINSISKANLKNAIVKEWYDVDGSIIKVLDIDDNEIEYRLETGYSWMNTTLGSYDWKIVSGSKIKIKIYSDKYKTYRIEFNSNKNVLKITPAITSTDLSETWYHID